MGYNTAQLTGQSALIDEYTTVQCLQYGFPLFHWSRNGGRRQRAITSTNPFFHVSVFVVPAESATTTATTASPASITCSNLPAATATTAAAAATTATAAATPTAAAAPAAATTTAATATTTATTTPTKSNAT